MPTAVVRRTRRAISRALARWSMAAPCSPSLSWRIRVKPRYRPFAPPGAGLSLRGRPQCAGDRKFEW